MSDGASNSSAVNTLVCETCDRYLKQQCKWCFLDIPNKYIDDEYCDCYSDEHIDWVIDTAVNDGVRLKDFDFEQRCPTCHHCLERKCYVCDMKPQWNPNNKSDWCKCILPLFVVNYCKMI